jgi:type II secretory pathway pseudopilin PulG
MTVVAIIGMLATIAVPNFISYRNKSRVAVAVSTGDGIRAALASYAADSASNLYSLRNSIDTAYDQLVLIANSPVVFCHFWLPRTTLRPSLAHSGVKG